MIQREQLTSVANSVRQGGVEHAARPGLHTDAPDLSACVGKPHRHLVHAHMSQHGQCQLLVSARVGMTAIRQYPVPQWPCALLLCDRLVEQQRVGRCLMNADGRDIVKERWPAENEVHTVNRIFRLINLSMRPLNTRTMHCTLNQLSYVP